MATGYDENKILTAYTIRFDGYAYSDHKHLDMAAIVDNCLQTENIDLPLPQRMTSSFRSSDSFINGEARPCPKHRGNGNSSGDYSLAYTIMTFYLGIQPWNKEWEAEYRPIIDQIKDLMKEIHENTIYDKRIKEQFMPNECGWLHEQLEVLPIYKYPLDTNLLPRNGIYFFYEKGEFYGHESNMPHIVRIGTHRDGNFKSRITDHFLLNEEKKMNFSVNRAAPKDRSIFRKNIGRALLNKWQDGYLPTWEIDFTTRANKDKYGHLRNIEKEKEVERKITGIIRETFSFRFIIIEKQIERMGNFGLESNLIGTIARCEACKPSPDWLGNHSPVDKIRTYGVWLFQHLTADAIDDLQKEQIMAAIRTTNARITE